jgi:hypothetical protein
MLEAAYAVLRWQCATLEIDGTELPACKTSWPQTRDVIRLTYGSAIDTTAVRSRLLKDSKTSFEWRSGAHSMLIIYHIQQNRVVKDCAMHMKRNQVTVTEWR